MGRWVTTKEGRRWYIPDEGEENPFADKEDNVRLRGIIDSINMMDKYGIKSTYDKDKNEYIINKNDYNKMLEAAKNKKYIERLQAGKGSEIQTHGYIDKQIHKDFDTKEKQIAENKAEADKFNGKTSYKPRYYTESELSDSTFRKEALDEMKRYERNWSFYSKKEKQDISPNGVRELRNRIKEIEDYEKTIKNKTNTNSETANKLLEKATVGGGKRSFNI